MLKGWNKYNPLLFSNLIIDIILTTVSLSFQYIGTVGTVLTICESIVYVKFKGVESCLHLNPAILKKLNKFSIDQVIRIRDDEATLQIIEKKLKCSSKVLF